jgi:hypothetical protein
MAIMASGVRGISASSHKEVVDPAAPFDDMAIDMAIVVIRCLE